MIYLKCNNCHEIEELNDSINERVCDFGTELCRKCVDVKAKAIAEARANIKLHAEREGLVALERRKRDVGAARLLQAGVDAKLVGAIPDKAEQPKNVLGTFPPDEQFHTNGYHWLQRADLARPKIALWVSGLWLVQGGRLITGEEMRAEGWEYSNPVTKAARQRNLEFLL